MDKFGKQNLLRYTAFSVSSNLVQSVVDLYWFDVYLKNKDSSALPYDCHSDCNGQLFLDPNQPRLCSGTLTHILSSRWDYTTQELTPQLDSIFVTSMVVERLLLARVNRDEAWLLARQWFQTHRAGATRYLDQFAKKQLPPDHSSFFGMTPGVDLVLVYLKVW